MCSVAPVFPMPAHAHREDEVQRLQSIASSGFLPSPQLFRSDSKRMNKRQSFISLGMGAILVLVLFSGCGLSNSPLAPNRDSVRVLHFPNSRSLGKLFLIEEDLSFLSGSGEEEKGDAQGTVRVVVPEGWFLELRMSPEASTDLSGLSMISRNDLQAISLYNTQVTDKELSHLQKLTGIQSIDLSSTKINGAGLVYLNRLQRLNRLNLSYTGVTDAGLAHLTQIPSLQSLNLSKTKISDHALNIVKELPRLQDLNLYYTNVGDAGLQRIQQLAQLQSLDIGWTRVTDAGLAYLTRLTQLRKLGLDSTKISDVGLQKLHAASGLQRLSLNDVSITEDGVKQLSKHISPCSIDTNVIDKRRLFPSCYAP
jgi:hypothetical protein